MKANKYLLSLTLIIIGQSSFAQLFTEVIDTPFENVVISSTAVADIEGDGDLDVFISGLISDAGDLTIAKLYTNENGVFTEVIGTPFIATSAGSSVFADVDGDNDSDLLLIGDLEGGTPFAILYMNEGGNFTEAKNTPFIGGEGGSINFSDIDGDGDLDVFITGEGNSGPKSGLYSNENGIFTEIMATGIADVYFGDCSFADIDGDNDPDLFITGIDDQGDHISKLYLNDQGTFNEKLDIPFPGVGFYSSVAFADIDGDNDPDLFISGTDNQQNAISKLYKNDDGSFMEVSNTPFEGIHLSSAAFSDVDLDDDPDLFISGTNNQQQTISKLYQNDNGSFNEVNNTSFEALTWGSISFFDIDNDGDKDLLTTGKKGFNDDTEIITKLYKNESVTTSVLDEINLLDFQFEVYPNPTMNEKLYVHMDSKKHSVVHLCLYDLKGNLMTSRQEILRIDNQSITVDISNFLKGNYFIRLDDGLRQGAKQFTVQ